MEQQYKYDIGQTVRVKAGFYEGETFVIDEDTRELSGGTISIPTYYCPRAGSWYFEDEVELADQSV